MSEISLYEAQKKKMQGLCDEHELVYRFRKDAYPITFTIRPTQGMDAQMTMLENVEEKGYISPDASMMWIFEDGILKTKVQGGTFTISKVLRTKIETVLMKMITFWQQYFFRDIMEKDILKGRLPVIDEDEANDSGDELPDGAVPLDTYEDDGELPDTESVSAEDEDGDDLADDGAGVDFDADDPEIIEAAKIVRVENKATTSLLQRRMKIGYAKAARIIDALEQLGIVGPYNGSDPREVLPFDEPVDGDAEEGVEPEC